MSEFRQAVRDLATVVVDSVTEGLNAGLHEIRMHLVPEAEDDGEEDIDGLEYQLEDLRMRIGAVNTAWNEHQQKHDTFAMDQRQMWKDIVGLTERMDKKAPEPTLVDKLNLQKLQQNQGMLERHVTSLLLRVEELERKEAERGIASSGTPARQPGVQTDDNVQSVRVWCKASGAGCSGATNWVATGDSAAAGQNGPDPSVEVGGPAAVQPGSGADVPAADGGKQPAPGE